MWPLTSALDACADRITRRFDVPGVWDLVERLVRHDRYQASLGIERAADDLAHWLIERSVPNVHVDYVDVDEPQSWWSFAAPRPWTPFSATLGIDGPRPFSLLRFPQDRMSLATHSAPTEGPLIVDLVDLDGRAHGSFDGALVLVADGIPDHRICRQLEECGASGFVASAGARRRGGRGRIELPSSTGLYGFSVSPSVLNELYSAARSGRQGRAEVDARHRGSMPIVSAYLPGACDQEVWLSAHLCHPGPGANDNASGAAAIAGIADALAATPRRRALRFIWAPEFVGSAAHLHRYLATTERLPLAVINLDMVAADRARTGTQLVIERCPAHTSGFLDELIGAVADRCLPVDRPWRSEPFTGRSDHAIFADRHFARPAVQLGHPDDPFNHSSSDDLDVLDVTELTWVATVAGTAAGLLSAEESLLDHDIVDLACSSPHRNTSHGGPLERIQRELIERSALTLPPLPMATGRGLTPCWEGPVNLRAAELVATGDRYESLASRWHHDRSIYSDVVAIALSVNGQANASEVISNAASMRGRPINPAVADDALKLFQSAGWII